MPIDLKDTLNLPKTDFPMRASLVEREPERLRHWEKLNLYQAIQGRRADAETFVLHDGPPFTNGDVHIGTAMNKLLKDIILRYKSMRGYRTPYIPGWDCHGLPIEHKVARARRESGESLEPAEVRKACAKFSADYIETQRAQFKRLGVLADWAREYRTMKPAYEADILRTFAHFVEQDLVYRSKKPVYWSIPCETALAEAEIEYKDHVSPSIWVAFPLPESEAQKASLAANTQVVIWTTTPWTLPANLAVAVHPELDYVEVRHEGKVYLVAAALAESFISACKLEGAELGASCSGRSLEGLQCRHPFIDRASPIVLADYVTTESGTGCVHTAPGHGLEDYLTGLNYKLEIYCPLDDGGSYVDDGQVPAELVGVSVLETDGKCPANIEVLKLLKRTGALLHKENYTHQYPHCWRSKTPVIFRAMDQWFVALDKDGKRQAVLEEIGNVQWIPDWGQNRIRGAVENRPDWCISRQRSWGVPLPAFYNEAGEALLDADVIRKLAEKIEQHGTDYWFEQDAEVLLAGIALPDGWESRGLKKGVDTLDVWIDSGCSHRAVLQRQDDLHWPADLYLEGSDQHRGWFQSSIWTGIVADGKAPYKSILTHGFIVDESKRKISKSDGKPQTADSYVNQYGADLVRLWVASVDYRNDVPISEKIFKQVVNTYRTIRNTLRFQTGNLYDFDPERDSVPYAEMTALDKWALHKLHAMVVQAGEAYNSYEFHRVYQCVNTFCNETLSALYHDILKDRLYTSAPHWQARRSSQTAIHHILDALLRVLAPILNFTADEAWSHANAGADFTEDSVHLQDWPELPAEWAGHAQALEIERLLAFRDKVNEQLEVARQAKIIGQSLDAQVILTAGEEDALWPLLEQYQDDLCELFIVSQVKLVPGSGQSVSVEVKHAEGVRCPRSWRWVEALVPCEHFGEVSPRCCDALQAQNSSSMQS